jgi:hypothetical protein
LAEFSQEPEMATKNTKTHKNLPPQAILFVIFVFFMAKKSCFTGELKGGLEILSATHPLSCGQKYQTLA